MAHYLVSTRGSRVAHFNTFQQAKVHQCLAFVRGVEYSIEEELCEGGCSYPQCYVPCKDCSAHIKPVEVQLDEAIYNRSTLLSY